MAFLNVFFFISFQWNNSKDHMKVQHNTNEVHRSIDNIKKMYDQTSKELITASFFVMH
jgi:hypothetical protein